MKYKGLKAFIASLLIFGSIAASAQPWNFGLIQRMEDDSDWQNIQMPDFNGIGSSTRALIGTSGFGGNGAYYFFGPTLRLDTATGLAEGGRFINVDFTGVNPYDIGNLFDLMEAKASNASVAPIQSNVASLLNSNSMLMSNVYGTSTSMGCETASTTHCLILKSSWNDMTSQVSALASSSAAKVFTNPSRSVNSAFRVSTTTVSNIAYSVSIANTLNLSGGAAGLVYLEYADDSGFTTNVKEAGRVGNSNSGGLVVGLSLNDQVTLQVSGMIPAGKYVRLRTVNTTGTPTYTLITSQEVY